MSDDEDFRVKNDDEAWNPKIKMSNLGPRQGAPLSQTSCVPPTTIFNLSLGRVSDPDPNSDVSVDPDLNSDVSVSVYTDAVRLK